MCQNFKNVNIPRPLLEDKSTQENNVIAENVELGELSILYGKPQMKGRLERILKLIALW